MTLQDALRVIQRGSQRDISKRTGVFLACGFTPLHLKTFLHAWILDTLRDSAFDLHIGLYGDLRGNLRRAAAKRCDVCFVALEWPDIDGRLDLRTLATWQPSQLSSILDDARSSLGQLSAELIRLASVTRVVMALPTLPLPPVSHFPVRQLSPFEAELHKQVYEFAQRLAADHVHILSEHQLLALSPPPSRRDVAADFLFGFPYTTQHASALGQSFAGMLRERAPKKGLITDLDNTLWKGVVGEIGPDRVSWDLHAGAQIHGLYQRLLDSLVAAGVLVGVASKNDPAVAEEALERKDLVVKSQQLFPREIGWHSKSESVARILKTWNIGADAVVCVDDSALELAEIQRVYPQVTGIRFPNDDPRAAYEVLCTLRDLFGKTTLAAEDSLRAESLHSRALAEQSIGGEGQATMAEFLESLEAEITLDARKTTTSRRPFELVNKTNQFNLNGRRIEWADWCRELARPSTFQWTIAYRDKYGPLGEIAVLLGRIDGSRVSVQTWVMSCRAFSRTIEHAILRSIFEQFDVTEVRLEYAETARNGPMRDFLIVYGAAEEAADDITLTRAQFDAHVPEVFLAVKESAHAGSV